MDIKTLTPEQKAELKKQLAQEAAEEQAAVQQEREAYKSLVNETVPVVFKQLEQIRDMLIKAKQKAFADMQGLIDMKCDLFKVRDNQQSHTFTTDDNSLSLKLGYRIVDGWDDTVGAGVSKVRDWIASLAKDEPSAMLVEMVTNLLKPDVKGNLKASRVLELTKHAEKVNAPELLDGVRIIREAYKPVRTCSFVEAIYRDEEGKEHSLPLSMSAVPLNNDK